MLNDGGSWPHGDFGESFYEIPCAAFVQVMAFVVPGRCKGGAIACLNFGEY